MIFPPPSLFLTFVPSLSFFPSLSLFLCALSAGHGLRLQPADSTSPYSLSPPPVTALLLSINIVKSFPFSPLIVAVLSPLSILPSPNLSSDGDLHRVLLATFLRLATSRLALGGKPCLSVRTIYSIQYNRPLFDLRAYDLHDIHYTITSLLTWVMSCQELVLSFWLALSSR